MGDLIVITFDGEGTADRAMASVWGVERGGVGLDDTAVVAKNRAGKVRVKNEWSSGAENVDVAGGFLGAPVTFFFPPVDAAIDAGLGALVGNR